MPRKYTHIKQYEDLILQLKEGDMCAVFLSLSETRWKLGAEVPTDNQKRKMDDPSSLERS